MLNCNNQNNNFNSNNPNLCDLKYEFIKLKRNELLGLINGNNPTCDTKYKKLTLNSDSFFNNLYLLLTGYSAALVVVNLITNNVLHIYTNLFVLVLLLFNNNLLSLVYKLFTVFLLLVIKLLFLCSKSKYNNKLNNTLFFVYVVSLNLLFLLNFIANRYNLNNSNANSRNRNRVNKVIKVFNSSELYSYLVGNLVFLSVIYFIVKLYTISYILIIIVVFLLISRYRLTDLYNYKNAKEKSRKSNKKSTYNRVYGVHFFPIVQNLITAILLLIVLFIIIFTLAPNNILHVNNYVYINKFITLNKYSKMKLLYKVKFLILYTFFILALLLVLVIMYLFYFFSRFNPFLNSVLFNSYYLFATVGSYDYNSTVRRLFLKNKPTSTDNLDTDNLNDYEYHELNNNSKTKLKVYLYYVDVHFKLVNVKPVLMMLMDSKNYDDNDYLNNKLNKMYSKFVDKKNKLHQYENENYFLKKLSTKLSSKYMSSSSKEHLYQEENECRNSLLSLYEKHNSSVGCSYHYSNTYSNTHVENFIKLLNYYGDDFSKPDTAELFYYLQRYRLLNHNEPSQFCLLTFQSSKKKARYTNNYFNRNYLGLKFKLLQYLHEFNCCLYLLNNDLEKQEDKKLDADKGDNSRDHQQLLKQQENNNTKDARDVTTNPATAAISSNTNIKQKLTQQEKEEYKQEFSSNLKEMDKKDSERKEIYRLSIPTEYLNESSRSNVTHKTYVDFLNNEYLSHRQRESQMDLDLQQKLINSSNNDLLLNEKMFVQNRDENLKEYADIVENFNVNLLKEKYLLLDEDEKMLEAKLYRQQEALTLQLPEETQQLLKQQENNNTNNKLNENVAVYNRDDGKDLETSSVPVFTLSSSISGENVKSNRLNEMNKNKDNQEDGNQQPVLEEEAKDKTSNEEDNTKSELKNKKRKEKKDPKKKKQKYLTKLFNLKLTNVDGDKEENDLEKQLVTSSMEKVDDSLEVGSEDNKEKEDENESKKEEQNTYVHEYVVATSDNQTKMFSNNYMKQESTQQENNKIKKLKLNNHYINTYSYNMNFNYYLNKTNKTNEINKYDSSGTNLLTTGVSSFTDNKDVDGNTSGNGSSKDNDNGEEFQEMEEFKPEEEKEDVEKVNNIMNDLMKDLNLDL